MEHGRSKGKSSGGTASRWIAAIGGAAIAGFVIYLALVLAQFAPAWIVVITALAALGGGVITWREPADLDDDPSEVAESRFDVSVPLWAGLTLAALVLAWCGLAYAMFAEKIGFSGTPAMLLLAITLAAALLVMLLAVFQIAEEEDTDAGRSRRSEGAAKLTRLGLLPLMALLIGPFGTLVAGQRDMWPLAGALLVVWVGALLFAFSKQRRSRPPA